MITANVHTIPLGNVSPVEPLGQSVNVFLVGPPYTLINVGHLSQIDALKAGLRALKVSPGAIERILCTSWSLDVLGGTRHFPRADVFMLSPDGIAPHHFDRWVTSEKTRLGPYFDYVGADNTFTEMWFDGSPARVEMIPLHVGAIVAAGGLRLEVQALNGFDPGAMMLFDPEAKVLFSSEIVLSGLPAAVRNPQGFLGDLDRAAATEAQFIYPNHGFTSAHGKMDIKRAARWANNLLSNARHAMRGGVTLAEFIERDLGYRPDDAELALRMAAFHPFLDELVDSRVIDAEGTGMERIYGTNVETRV